MAAQSTSDAFSIPKSAVRQILLGIGVVVLVAVLVAIGIGIARLVNSGDALSGGLNHHEYQAVFLTNGQVYFGTLDAPGGSFDTLTNVFYLASRTNPQNSKSTDRTLVPLGREIHAPEDKMIINRTDILFVENLQPNGAVSRAMTRALGHQP